jgi:subtilisin-like proprotein convertase family protein
LADRDSRTSRPNRPRAGRTGGTRFRPAVTPLEDRIVLDAGDTLGTALLTGLGPAGGSFTHVEALGDGPFANRDVDLYRFQAAAGSRLTALTSQPPGGRSMDTILRLFNATGSQLAVNDDFGGTLYSRISFTFTTPGTYFLGVSGYANLSYNTNAGGSGSTGSTGDFRLDLALVSPEIPEIRGTQFTDLNGNGRRDPGEPPLAGLTVFLDGNNNGQLDPDEPSQVTDANGTYAFPNLAPGTYTVAQVAQPGLVQTFLRNDLVPTSSVNASRRAGNQTEPTIAVNPANPAQLFLASNLDGTGLFAASSTDGGASWTSRTLAGGSDGLPVACCDAQAAFDPFGNLFLVYLQTSGTRAVRILHSSNGGQTFALLHSIVGSSLDQPSIATGAGSVWVSYRDGAGTISAAGARVTGLGLVQAFAAPQAATSSFGGNFGNIAIGPAGQVLVTYQSPAGGPGPSTIYVNLDADGLGGGGFGPRVAVTNTNVGGFRVIPAQLTANVIDAEANLAWDRSGGPHSGRVYLAYTDAPSVASNDTNIFVRFSDDNGLNWSPPVRVNDDLGDSSQFLPAIAVDQATGHVALSWYDARNSSTNVFARLFAAVSTDNGASFLPNVAVGAGLYAVTTTDSAIVGYGDYLTLDFANGRVVAVWADNSNSTGDNPNGTGQLDLYTAGLTVEPSLAAVPHRVYVGPGQVVQEVNFGNQPHTAISGQQFHDVNGNGVMDVGEPALPGWIVYLDQNANGVLDQDTVTLASPNVPVAIPDLRTVTSTLLVSGLTGPITDVNVTLTLTHTFDADLDVFLISPSGTRIELFTDVGGSGDNFTNTTLDDEAPVSITAGSPPFTGRFRPEGRLADLIGQEPNGTWTLEITDDAGIDVGTLHGWSLTISTPAEPTALTYASGAYAFTGLDPGTYVVREFVRPGWQQSRPGGPDFRYLVTLTSGQVAADRDFGNYRPGEIRGLAFDDRNGNGARDAGEPSLPGWIVYVDENNNGILDQREAVLSSPNVPVAIPDLRTVTSTLVVSGLAGRITDVNLTLTIAHTFDADLDVFLISPSGTRIELFTDVGGSGRDFLNTTLDDEAPVSITAGTAPFSGGFRPEGLLSALDGQDPNGTWTLAITDDAALDVGTLQSWSLTITYAQEPFTLTNTSGAYAFTDLNPGSYTVREVLPHGWQQTRPGGPDFRYTVALTSGQVAADRDFGNTRLTTRAPAGFRSLGEPGETAQTAGSAGTAVGDSPSISAGGADWAFLFTSGRDDQLPETDGAEAAIQPAAHVAAVALPFDFEALSNARLDMLETVFAGRVLGGQDGSVDRFWMAASGASLFGNGFEDALTGDSILTPSAEN